MSISDLKYKSISHINKVIAIYIFIERSILSMVEHLGTSLIIDVRNSDGINEFIKNKLESFAIN